jgi:hypothetical protein
LNFPSPKSKPCDLLHSPGIRHQPARSPISHTPVVVYICLSVNPQQVFFLTLREFKLQLFVLIILYRPVQSLVACAKPNHIISEKVHSTTLIYRCSLSFNLQPQNQLFRVPEQFKPSVLHPSVVCYVVLAYVAPHQLRLRGGGSESATH